MGLLQWLLEGTSEETRILPTGVEPDDNLPKYIGQLRFIHKIYLVELNRVLSMLVVKFMMALSGFGSVKRKHWSS